MVLEGKYILVEVIESRVEVQIVIVGTTVVHNRRVSM